MAKKKQQDNTQENIQPVAGIGMDTGTGSEDGMTASKPGTRKTKNKAEAKTTVELQSGAAVPAKRGRPRKTTTTEMGSTAQEMTTQPKRGRSSQKKTDTLAQAPVEAQGLSIEPAPVAAQPAQEQTGPVYYDISRFSEFDVYLFREGRHYNLYDKFGSHLMERQGSQGAYFAVWAPNAELVSVMGDFNSWNRESHQLQARGDNSGIWEGFVPDVQQGMLYKYHIRSRYHLYHVEKSDPFAFRREKPPQTASVVQGLSHTWGDSDWMQQRKSRQGQPQPYSVYELHVGSWRRKPEDNNRPLTYRELAEELPAYVKNMGFTHVEFMPVMHHPFNGSWGYQITGYFAAASTYGSPEDLMCLIDALHKEGIGVIMDWVPSHFPSDEHGLAYFDGTHLYEHADPRKGYHPDWNSYIFNYGRNEVRSFLVSNALFWLDKYHVDGLRVDAVASMLYLDYSRKHNEWIPNEHGGRENLEAISLLKEFNQAVHERFPDTLTIAEESTAWPAVTGAVENGGLGFDMKWMMGWMHDTLTYFSKDPIYRRFHQGDITFSIIYAFTERFMLPLSHDEVVHGKGSLIRKMPGDEWQAFANLRALYAYMYAHPGAKLLFMGGELAQSTEWNHDSSLDWHLLQFRNHAGIQELVRQLNHVYKQEPGLYARSFDQSGFEWIDFADAHNSVISFMRKGDRPEDQILVVCNFTPGVHENYRLGVPLGGNWVEIFNSDDSHYGGSNFHNHGILQSVADSFHGRDYSLVLKLPPMAVVYFKFQPVG
ncbi:1,4-alpha-glucan branching protein GlgB [Pontibacter roseus]|uniref:1,4-alpha-glucan branching protein GlgB n=1 Tax=Pontibacter roseus TaxID=336989 RepID=UPI0003669079|nr:1,4-alpha-glucan branching protein GlgB [Pontibacter roseus]